MRAFYLLLVHSALCQSSNFSLPQQSPASFARNAALEQIQKQIINGPRYHKINGEDSLINYPSGPVDSYGSLYQEIVQREVQDMVVRDNKPVQQFLFQKVISGNFTNMGSVQGFTDMFQQFTPVAEVPYCLIDWQLDSSFGEAQLTFGGVELERAYTNEFELDDGLVKTITGSSVDTLISQARLFRNDLSFMSQYSLQNSTKYVSGSAALFYIAADDSFMPLAIKIQDTGLIYTPLDHPDHWSLAKTVFSVAESHNVPLTHFIVNHMAIEAARTELFRHVSASHPLYALLTHHFNGLYGNTFVGVRKIIQKGTSYDLAFGTGAVGLGKYVQDMGRKYHYQEANVAQGFIKKGIANIPNYKKYNDLMAIQNATNEFVADYLGLYYKSDQDVVEDYELLNWLNATQVQTNGFPTSMASFAELVEFVGDLIIRVSAHHHALNTENIWHGMNFPAYPKALWKPLPTNKDGDIQLRDYLVKDISILAAEIVTAAAYKLKVPENESFGRAYRVANFDVDANDAIEKYIVKLDQISDAINAREADRKRKYVILDPRHLADRAWI